MALLVSIYISTLQTNTGQQCRGRCVRVHVGCVGSSGGYGTRQVRRSAHVTWTADVTRTKRARAKYPLMAVLCPYAPPTTALDSQPLVWCVGLYMGSKILIILSLTHYHNHHHSFTLYQHHHSFPNSLIH